MPQLWQPQPQQWDVGETLKFLDRFYSAQRVSEGCEICLARDPFDTG
jgi:hypothetical protein